MITFREPNWVVLDRRHEGWHEVHFRADSREHATAIAAEHIGEFDPNDLYERMTT